MDTKTTAAAAKQPRMKLQIAAFALSLASMELAAEPMDVPAGHVHLQWVVTAGNGAPIAKPASVCFDSSKGSSTCSRRYAGNIVVPQGMYTVSVTTTGDNGKQVVKSRVVDARVTRHVDVVVTVVEVAVPGTASKE